MSPLDSTPFIFPCAGDIRPQSKAKAKAKAKAKSGSSRPAQGVVPVDAQTADELKAGLGNLLGYHKYFFRFSVAKYSLYLQLN